MAVAIGADADVAFLRLQMLGAYGETASQNTMIDGAYDDTETEQFLTDLDAVSRAGFTKSTISAEKIVTGMAGSPTSNDALSEVDDFLVLNFYQTHPLNPLKTITKSFLVRAPSSVVVDGVTGALIVAGTEGDRSSADESLRGVINWLSANMAYEDVSGDITVGGWTWDSATSRLAGGAFVAGA